MAMIARARRHLTSSTSETPPSPIPTAKGSRSAAVDDQILSDYLHKSLRIPDLTLPKSHFAADIHHRSVPVDIESIDYGSVKTRDSDSIRRILRSATDLGVFWISGVGVSADELRSTVTEAESILEASEGARRIFRINHDKAIGNEEEFVWLRPRDEMAESATEDIGCQRYHRFSEKMERISSRLDELAEELGLVFSENKGWQPQGRIPEIEPVLSLYRYSHGNGPMDDISPLPKETSSESGYHALTLHLPIHHSEFHIQSHRGPLSFNATPSSVVVTIGEHLEEWSQGKLKSASGEFLTDSVVHGSQSFFSIVLKCSPLSLNSGSLHQTTKVISIADQFLIAFILFMLHKITKFLFS